MKKINSVLVANRGEIAVRIIKALKEMGITTVAVFSEADKNAIHVRLADESVCIGEGKINESYLNTYKVLAAAEMKKVDAIHPGIGFFAENADFPDLCNEYNIQFIGPTSEIVKLMGNKSTAKNVAKSCGIPTIKGSDENIGSLDDCKEIISNIGLPVVLKATAGGGGKGIRKILDEKQIETNYIICKKEALSAFCNDDLIIEQFLQNVRHVEVQIIADSYGNTIHLGDRECTLQRSNQKLIEEARCVNIDECTRLKLYDDATRLAKHIGYIGPGTIEYLVMPSGDYYFLEMNTRLQVEHTITELITGIDLVKEQIKVFQGDRLGYAQDEVQFKGYALECRILAEKVSDSFSPSFGKILEFSAPGGLDVRVDSGVKCNDIITPYYDSLIMKLCCAGCNKSEAVKKMIVCLEELKIEGIDTNIDFLKFVIEDSKFISSNYNESYISEKLNEYHSIQRTRRC